MMKYKLEFVERSELWDNVVFSDGWVTVHNDGYASLKTYYPTHTIRRISQVEVDQPAYEREPGISLDERRIR